MYRSLDENVVANIIKVKNFSSNNRFELISLVDVRYLEYQPEYSLVFTESSKYLLPVSKQGFIDIIDTSNVPFFEVDKGLCVNLDLIKKIHSDANMIIFDDIDDFSEIKKQNLNVLYISSKRMKEFAKNIFNSKADDLAYRVEISKRDKTTVLFKKDNKYQMF